MNVRKLFRLNFVDWVSVDNCPVSKRIIVDNAKLLIFDDYVLKRWHHYE